MSTAPDAEEPQEPQERPDLEDGPHADPKPPAAPDAPQEPLSISEAQRLCANELHEVLTRYGFRIYARAIPREVSGGSVLIDCTWGLSPSR